MLIHTIVAIVSLHNQTRLNFKTGYIISTFLPSKLNRFTVHSRLILPITAVQNVAGLRVQIAVLFLVCIDEDFEKELIWDEIEVRPAE